MAFRTRAEHEVAIDEFPQLLWLIIVWPNSLIIVNPIDVLPERRLQNTLYPKGGRLCKNCFFLKILIGSQFIIEGRSLICTKRC